MHVRTAPPTTPPSHTHTEAQHISRALQPHTTPVHERWQRSDRTALVIGEEMKVKLFGTFVHYTGWCRLLANWLELHAISCANTCDSYVPLPLYSTSATVPLYGAEAHTVGLFWPLNGVRRLFEQIQYVCMYVYVRMYMYVYVCICMYMYVYVGTCM